jgi:hypothetical protein
MKWGRKADLGLQEIIAERRTKMYKRNQKLKM